MITNNHFEGKGIVNALELIHLLSGGKVMCPSPCGIIIRGLEKIADAPARNLLCFLFDCCDYCVGKGV